MEAAIDGGYEGGMSKWGAVDLALRGGDAYSILTYYYGDIIIVFGARPVEGKWPPLRQSLYIPAARAKMSF